MEVFRANIREREKFLDWVEKDGEIEGEWEKKMNKNIRERIFKWSCKKNKMFDVWYIVKWGVKIVKVVFWDYKC